jgi:ribonuclease BN (tRNA processing enzyme)
MIKLTTLGSGTFFVNKDVSASAFVLEAGGQTILIDCGPGTLVKLSHAGYTPGDIDHVLITHLHPDHTSDLFPFFMNFRLNDVFSPEVIDGFPTFWGPKRLSRYMLDYSHLSQLHSVENWGKIPFKPFGKEFKLGDITVKTYPVIHKPFGVDTEGYAIRFEIEGKVIAFSGDSCDCPGVREVCKDADIFICDASFPKSHEPDQIHMNTHEIGEIAEAGGVKEILLDHFYPQYSDVNLVGEVKEKYSGKVEKAVDLRVYQV